MVCTGGERLWEQSFAQKLVTCAKACEHGAWMLLATTTTVGYGDVTPKQGVSRVLTTLWMMVGFIATASVIGGVTTALSAPHHALHMADIAAFKDRRVCSHSIYLEELRQYVLI